MDANVRISQFGSAALITADAAVLVLARPDVPRLAHDLSAPTDWVARVGADGAAATLATGALWCLAAWVAVGLLVCLGAVLPGACGRMAVRSARRVLPAAVYRLVAGAAGLGVLLSPVAAGASAPGAPAATSAPAPAWPSDSPLPAPAWPATPAPALPHATPAPPVRAPAPAPAPATVVVRPGDSLWSIAAAHLPRAAGPPQVAREWPRWFAANRPVLGADPDLIRPGQVLHAPTPVQEHST